MGRANLEDNKQYGGRTEAGWFLRCLKTVPADNFQIDADMPPLLLLTPAGAIDVLMPASTPQLEGLTFIISNFGGGGAITLKTSADAAFTTAIVIAAGETTMVHCTGSATAALGWIGHATAPST